MVEISELSLRCSALAKEAFQPGQKCVQELILCSRIAFAAGGMKLIARRMDHQAAVKDRRQCNGAGYPIVKLVWNSLFPYKKQRMVFSPASCQLNSL
jgi:hypothetical protein